MKTTMWELIDRIVAGVISAAFLGFGGLCGIHSLFRVIRWNRGVGVVVGYKREEDCYCPRIEYEVGGVRRTFLASFGWGWRKFAKGATVPILYDPAKPERGDMATITSLWLLPTVLTLFGCLFLAAALRIGGEGWR